MGHWLIGRFLGLICFYRAELRACVMSNFFVRTAVFQVNSCLGGLCLVYVTWYHVKKHSFVFLIIFSQLHDSMNVTQNFVICTFVSGERIFFFKQFHKFQIIPVRGKKNDFVQMILFECPCLFFLLI